MRSNLGVLVAHPVRLLVATAALGMAMVVVGFGWIVDRVAIRDPGMHPPAVGQVAFTVRVEDGIDMPVYSAGSVGNGCVVFFPGQHGLGGFESRIVPLMASRGVATFTATYAPAPRGSRLTLAQAERFALGVVRQVEARCGERYVVVGRSLGAMVAAYAVRQHHPAALLLEGASPSLAAAVRSMLKPWLGHRLAGLVPVERLLARNYNLQDALGAERRFPVTIIQGTHDLQTPMSDLAEPGALPSGVEIVPVQGADHQGTWQAFVPQYADRIVGALAQGLPEQLRRQALQREDLARTMTSHATSHSSASALAASPRRRPAV